MKKLFGYCSAVALMVVACAHNTQAQTNSNTLGDQFKSGVMSFTDNITTATNWNTHIEAMYFETLKKHYGARIGFDYLISPNVYSTLSLCEADGTLYGMTGTFGIKKTLDVGGKGKFLITLAGKAGVGTTLSGMQFGSFTVPGKSTSSGEFFGTIGSDIVFSCPTLKYAPDILVGYEKWSNMPGNIYSVGLHWPLHVFTDLL